MKTIKPGLILYYKGKNDKNNSSYNKIRWLHEINQALFRGYYVQNPNLTFVISYSDVIPHENQEKSIYELRLEEKK